MKTILKEMFSKILRPNRLSAPPCSEFKTEHMGKWQNPTEEVHAALRGEIPATRDHVRFCRVAAKDAEGYGDHNLATENYQCAERLKKMEFEQRFNSQNNESRNAESNNQ